MSQLDDILARSRVPGSFVERSRFTLARDKAVEKMRQYALRNPRRYILEAIQGAVFSGARFLAIDVSADRISIAWVGGTGYQPHELENLLDYLLSRRHEGGHRHVVQLAIAVNALLQRKPKLIRIESGDGTSEGTVRVELDSEGHGVRGNPEEGLAGTYIYADFDQGWLSGFTGEKYSSEEMLVESSCQYCTVPILLNGRAPFGWRGGRPQLDGANFDDGQRWGTIYRAHPSDDRFRIVMGGVVVAEIPLPELGSRLHEHDLGPENELLVRGIICDDGLRQTADHSDIVRDSAFYEMLHALQPHATEFLRVRDPNYVPPPLDPIPDKVVEAREEAPRVEPEPLPDQVVQLGRRPLIPVSAIGADAPDEPAFWVRPRDASRLVEAASIARLPYPVYLLTPGQVRTLEETFPEQSVLPLGRSADVDFVVRALERFAIRPFIEVPFEGGPGQGTVVIRATLSGPRIRWDGQSTTDQVPVVVQVGGDVVHAGSLPDLRVPRLDVVCDLDTDSVARGSEYPYADLLAPLQYVVARELWRLFAQLVKPHGDRAAESARRDILASGLAVVAQPHFVRGEGQTELVAHFPAELNALESSLRETPLANTADGGTLSFEQFVALQGTRETVALASDADLFRMEPLEERFGYGNLTRPQMLRPMLLVAAMDCPTEPGTQRWALASPDDLQPYCLAAIWVGRCLNVDVAVEGLTPKDLFLAGVGCAIREGRQDTVSIRAGLSVLFETMMALQNNTSTSSGASRAQLDERDMEMIQIATAALVDTDAEWRNMPLFRVGSEMWSLGRIRDRPEFGVVPYGGVSSASDHVVSLTLDEVRAIERAKDTPVPLCFDDPPDVWTEAERGDWLLRVPIRYGDIRGWMGLRYPFDATGGVLFRSESAMAATPRTRRQVPSHGMVWSSNPRDTAQSMPHYMVDLASRKLYQALGEGLRRQRWAGDRATAAHQYARAWILDEVARGDKTRSAVGKALAQVARVPNTDGSDWGHMAQWLVTAAANRPSLQHRHSSESVPIEQRALPARDLELAPWITELLRGVTGEPNLTVTVNRVSYTNAKTLQPNEKIPRVLIGGPHAGQRTWRRCHFSLRGDLARWADEPQTALEVRWMVAMTVLRRWLPTLRQNLVDVDFERVQQDMLSRLMAASLD